MNLNRLTGKGLLIHHWDTDGICSARLLLEKLKRKTITNVTPHLGNYYLTHEELEQYNGYDFVIVVDMALPEDNINTLAKHAEVMIFDHHLQPENTKVFHHNPIIKGENPDQFPSASWIVNTYLGNKINLFAILGVLGDHEQKIKNNTYFMPILQQFLTDHDLTMADALRMVYLLDSNYKLGDKQAVEQAPHYLLTHDTPKDILEHKQWNTNLGNLEQEINRTLTAPADMDTTNMIVKTINTKYNIISTITRKIAWDSGKNTLIINTGFFKDKDQVYMRSKKNTKPMIDRGKQLGFKCGGKKEVLGAIIPKEHTASFVEELKEFIKQP